GTFTKSSTPSNLNACPTSPAAHVAPFISVPLLPSAQSFATVPAGLSSARYQLTRSSGGNVANSTRFSKSSKNNRPETTTDFRQDRAREVTDILSPQGKRETRRFALRRAALNKSRERGLTQA